MTSAQKRLRDLRERQSRERGRMAELSLVDELGDEHRAELDTIEKGTGDLERQLRAAVIALEDEEREAETRAVNDPDTEQRERVELRSKAMLTNYLMNAARGRMVDGAEAELQAAAGVGGHGIPLELWGRSDIAPRRRRRARDPRDHAGARHGWRQSRCDPSGCVCQQHRAAPGNRNAACDERHLCQRHDHDFSNCGSARQGRGGRRRRRSADCHDRDPEARIGAT